MGLQDDQALSIQKSNTSYHIDREHRTSSTSRSIATSSITGRKAGSIQKLYRTIEDILGARRHSQAGKNPAGL